MSTDRENQPTYTARMPWQPTPLRLVPHRGRDERLYVYCDEDGITWWSDGYAVFRGRAPGYLRAAYLATQRPVDAARLVYAPAGGREAIGNWLVRRGSWPGALLCPVAKGGRIQQRSMSAQAVLLRLRHRDQLRDAVGAVVDPLAEINPQGCHPESMLRDVDLFLDFGFWRHGHWRSPATGPIPQPPCASWRRCRPGPGARRRFPRRCSSTPG